MKYRMLLLVLIVFITACGNGQAQTVELPVNPPEPTTVIEPTAVEQVEETEAAPTEEVVEPTPMVEPTAEPTATLEPTVEPTEKPDEPTEINQDELVAALLSISDMPTGWAGTAPTFEESTPGDTYNLMCNPELPARSIAKAEANYEKGGFGPFFRETIVIYPNKADAEATFQDIADTSQACLEWEDTEGTSYVTTPLSFPKFGDETLAVRTTGSLEVDLVYVRVDEAIIGIMNATFGAGVDSELTETLTTLAVDKYK